MAIMLGIDLGTTTITAVAVELESGRLVGRTTRPNSARLPSDDLRSEWDSEQILDLACDALHELAGQIASPSHLLGLGITGQQHGMMLVDSRLNPLSPFINWQDRRASELFPGENHSHVEEARRRIGPEARQQTGCLLSNGYMAVTLFWLAQQTKLPAGARACLLMDYATARWTGTGPITDATCAASAGVFDLHSGDWAWNLLDALGLPAIHFVPIRPSGIQAGGLMPEFATRMGLPDGLPIFAGIGDNQASFLGSVADLQASLLVNVGTGGQVAMWTPEWLEGEQLETRPFPLSGNLLVSAGLTGGAAYAQLEQFFRRVILDLTGKSPPENLYPIINRLAEAIAPGSEGVVCEPFFAGTRYNPEWRASWSRLSTANFTPGHLARSLLEGMARTLATSAARMEKALAKQPSLLVGAGNGIRSNPLLSRIVSDVFQQPMHIPLLEEEAAIGAVRLAAVWAGAFEDLPTSARLIRYTEDRQSEEDRT